MKKANLTLTQIALIIIALVLFFFILMMTMNFTPTIKEGILSIFKFGR